MPANPKTFIHGTLIEIGFRTQKGLPFSPTPYMLVIIRSILGRAQSLYNFTLCHAVMMPNHGHFLGVVRSPENVPLFVGYVKRELAHAVNSLAGEHGLTVWAAGYDSPIILDAAKAIERIVYAYTNPQKANLEDTIERYTNFTTWQAFLNGGEKTKVKHIPRNKIPELPRRTLNFKEQQELASKLEQEGTDEHVLKIEPDAWMSCFPALDGCDREEINAEILKRVREKETEFRKIREHPVLGAEKLRSRPKNDNYRPTKKGPRSICLATLCSTRVHFIEWFREHIAPLRRKTCELRPAGLFAPGGSLCANLNPSFVPLF